MQLYYHNSTCLHTSFWLVVFIMLYKQCKSIPTTHLTDWSAETIQSVSVLYAISEFSGSLFCWLPCNWEEAVIFEHVVLAAAWCTSRCRPMHCSKGSVANISNHSRRRSAWDYSACCMWQLRLLFLQATIHVMLATYLCATCCMHMLPCGFDRTICEQGQGAFHDNIWVAPAWHPPAAIGVEQAGPQIHGHPAHGLLQGCGAGHQVQLSCTA